MKPNTLNRFPIKQLLAVALAAVGIATAQGAVVYSESFTGYTAGTLDGQGGWTSPSTTPVSVITTALTGLSGTHVQGTATTGTEESINTTALSALTIDTTSITIDVLMRGATASGFETTVGILNSSGSTLFEFGSVASTGFRLLNDTGAIVSSGTGSGDDTIGSSHIVFAHRFTYSFDLDTWSWEVRNTAGDASYLLLDSGTASEFGAGLAIDNIANWSGASIAMATASDRIDSISVTAIPEPAAALLGSLGLLALLRRRRN